ncbi:hypothetical protein [Hymenobacter sp.]|uniref:hypothetical protein n=1 Tax=Hymenobacter sp. TaxID=1898978 RepID=UPI00286B6C12|nr:hypothetical protein [Hymenobacter sp.]
MVEFTLNTSFLRVVALRAAAGAGVCMALGTAVQAQQRPRVATRIDSLRAARDGTPTYFPAQVTLTSGKQVRAYLPSYTTCFLERVECYETSPEHLPRPALKALDVARVKEMTVDGHRYESLSLKGKPLGLLAENLTAPGPVELFGYAKTKNDMLIPIPLPVGAVFVSTGTHEKYYWYVRPSPGAALREVPRGGGDFAKTMSVFFAADDALAARVRQQEKGARVENMPELVRAYNAHSGGK